MAIGQGRMARTAMTFEEWKVSVNFWVRREVGLDVDDLPDCPYRDWYESGVRPRTAASRAIKNAKE